MTDRNRRGRRVPALDLWLPRANGRRSQVAVAGCEVGATVQLEPVRCRANLEHGGMSGGARELVVLAIPELFVTESTRRPGSLLLCSSVAHVHFLQNNNHTRVHKHSDCMQFVVIL